MKVDAGPRRFNRKDPHPSANMSPSDGLHYRCQWIENSMTVHSDGNVTCGLDDPHGQRSFGNVKFSSIEAIFANPEYRTLQDKLWNGHRCGDCGLYRQVEQQIGPPPAARPRLPTAVVIEPTVTCNIRCPNAACIPNNDPASSTRDGHSLSFETLRNVADQLDGSLDTIHFYNYGEPFMHRQAEDMLAYLRIRHPDAVIVTSTNGIPLSNPMRAEKIVLAALDRIIFTISGIEQKSYGQYHVAGKVDQAIAGLKNVCDAKRKHGREYPAVIWRYLVFHWNDTDTEIDAAISLAEAYGVDRFSLFLTDEPKGARSVRFSPGSPAYFRYRDYIHHDHLGRLDHLYHCGVPDENGFYSLEDLPELGWARRAASQVTLKRDGLKRRLRLAFSTDRAQSRDAPHTCRIETPWRTYEVPLTFAKWQNFSVRIPLAFRGPEQFLVKVSTDDFWFPAAEGDSADLRCLGFLMRAESAWQYFLRSRAPESIAKIWRDRIARTPTGRLISALAERLLPIVEPEEGVARSSAAEKFAVPIERLYRALFCRMADSAGLSGWVAALRSGNWSLPQIIEFFIASDEFRAVYGESPSPGTFVSILCRNLAEHLPQDADCEGWADYLTRSGNTRSAKAVTVVNLLGLPNLMKELSVPVDRRGRSLMA